MEVTYHRVAQVHVDIQILGILSVSILNLESPSGAITVGALSILRAASTIGILSACTVGSAQTSLDLGGVAGISNETTGLPALE